MVHGSSHTAACLESTPDGREGWYPYFVRKGISTYVVDQTGRGRSGVDQSVIHEAEALIERGDSKGGPVIAQLKGRPGCVARLISEQSTTKQYCLHTTNGPD